MNSRGSFRPSLNVADKPAPDDWFIAVYPDGCWCDWRLRHHWPHRGDDYECREVLTCNQHTGQPVLAVLRPPPPEGFHWLRSGINGA